MLILYYSVLIDDFVFFKFQYQRARVIYKYALDRLPKENCQQLYKAYTVYEKKFGDQNTIEVVISSKRKFQYEQVRNVIQNYLF